MRECEGPGWHGLGGVKCVECTHVYISGRSDIAQSEARTSIAGVSRDHAIVQIVQFSGLLFASWQYARLPIF